MNGEHDGRIDTVLQALRNAEPGDAMQDRLIASLHRAQAAPAEGTKTRRWPHWALTLPVAGSFALAATLLGVTAALLHRSGPSRADHVSRSVPVKSGISDPTVPQGAVERASSSKAPSYGQESPEKSTATTAESHATSRKDHSFSSQNGAPRPTQAPETKDVAHGARSVEASLPAPSLPLTEQERLLLRLVHREHATQLAPLTVAFAEEAALREKNAVDEFFATAPSLQDEQEPAPEQPAGQP